MKHPKISFCIATYKRPKFLKNTISSILVQKYDNIEIVVSDNDPGGSGEKVIKFFKGNNVIYHKNKKNLGMVKNFNAAFSKASGDFTTFIADDDPVEKDMLATLIPLYLKHPEFDSFFGACNIFVPDGSLAKIYGFQKGLTPLTTDLKMKNEISLFSPDTFLREFLLYRITTYFLWSTGFVRTRLVKQINGMPDYRSAFLTDFSYLCQIGTLGKTIVINKPLARQTIHTGNYGRDEEALKTLPDAVSGFHKIVYPLAKERNLTAQYKSFISNWVIDHLTNVAGYYEKRGSKVNKSNLLKTYDAVIEREPFFRFRKFELYLKLQSPAIFNPFFSLFYRIKRKAALGPY